MYFIKLGVDYNMVKRFLDFIFSGILILILSPLFLVVGVAIKLTSKGPVFFKQQRVGKDNKHFMIYKFRTMKIDAPPNVATYMLKNPDEYITPIGRFLRNSSIDEIPQLINIFKGDMSFVGPRPVITQEIDLISLRTRTGVSILSPGLTGWAQINGRDALGIEEKVFYDKYYLENQSLILDLKIMFLTVLKVIKAEGIVEGEVSDRKIADKR